MKINWFTVIAQVINFLILVWLLKRFLYKPVLNAIDEREKKITSQLKDAEDKETNAKKEQDEFREKNETFDKEKKKLMEKAITETNEERQKLIEAARNEAAELRSKLEKSLKAMEENIEHDIAQKTQHEVFAIARKTLSDLASQSLEEQSANIFIKRLNELNKEEKKKFIGAFKSGSNLSAGRQGLVLVQSAFDLPEKQQVEIKSSVNHLLGIETHFKFKTSPELISGIELTSNGYKLAWSISEYLNSLQKNISETMKKETKKEPKKVPKEVPKKKSKEPREVPDEVMINEPQSVPKTEIVEVPTKKQKEVPKTKSKSKSKSKVVLGKK